MNQSQAMKILESGENVFLTGSAGTGKTFLINEFIGRLKEKKIKVGITASTGIAATHIGGRTIHSWAGIGIEKKLSPKKINKILRNKKVRQRIEEARVLIIDEISMLDADRLNLTDEICKAIKNPFLPFGGIQIVLSGDFFQLPPVEKGAKFAYESLAWKEAKVKVCYLDEQFRQDDATFTDLLNKIRSNSAGTDEMNSLKSRLFRSIVGFKKPTKLYTHNADVDAVNSYELSRVPGKESVYPMTERGPRELVNFLKKSCLAPEELKLKIGAMVMFVKNNFEAGYVNGTLGTVVGFNEDEYPVVKIRSGSEITAVSSGWEIEEDEKVIAAISQIPLRLAWAITVHKSQGMSLDAAEIDLSRSFEYGMGYVALSRVRTLAGMRLIGINEEALRVDPKVLLKDLEFKNLSK
ncbi:MAG: PIF1 family DEAD/DEAH box helicase [Patescibacteria group bacterium]|jgi:ATP-dependent exoDNAse (exonuclease V) alpha subunit